MNTYQHVRLAIAIVTHFYLIQESAAFSSDPEIVDPSPVLEFEGYTVSQYILDKNFNSHISTSESSPDKAYKTDWFKKFIAEQALIAELRSQNWCSREDVTVPVNAMERYMLSQEHGPFLSAEIPMPQLTPTEIEQARQQSQRRASGTFISFSNTNVNRYNGLRTGDIQSLLQGDSGTDIALTNSTLIWPFHPFMHLRDEILTAEPNKRYGPFYFAGTESYFELNKKPTGVTPPIDANDQAFQTYVQTIERSLQLEHYKHETLSNSYIQIFYTFDSLLQASQTNPDSTLLSFKLTEKDITVTIENFIKDQQYSIIANKLSSQEDLVNAIREYVFGYVCQHRANLAGVTSSPRFSENRRNFENNRILHVYREALKAELGPYSLAELQSTFLNSHYASKQKVLEIEGSLEFYTNWQSLTSDSLPDRVKNSVKVDLQDPPLFEQIPSELLFVLQDGEATSPIQIDSGLVVFRKQRTSRKRALIIEDVSVAIEEILHQRSLDNQLLKKFPKRARDLKLRCHIDFPSYGIDIPQESLNTSH